MTLITIRSIGFLAALSTLLVAGSASALTMDPGSVELGSQYGGTIEYELIDSSVGSTTILLFEVTTNPVVDDVVVIAFDAPVIGSDVLFDPDRIIAAHQAFLLFEGQLVVDMDGGESGALFEVELLWAPTRAGFFMLPTDQDPKALKAEVRFSSGVPEPNAAIVFAVGLLVVQGAVRRRRR